MTDDVVSNTASHVHYTYHGLPKQGKIWKTISCSLLKVMEAEGREDILVPEMINYRDGGLEGE
jgi:hypothetical protein